MSTQEKKSPKKSTTPVKWLKVPVPAELHTKVKAKAVGMGVTITDAVELAVSRWVRE